MFNQQQQFNNFGQPPYGQPYGNFNPYNNYGQQPEIKFNNALTLEEINKLKKNSSNFSLNLTEEEKLIAACNHRNENGTEYSCTFNDDGTVICHICGSTFNIVEQDLTEQEIENCVQGTINILESIKMFYPGLPQEVAREYFLIIPLLKKIPKLYAVAMKKWIEHNPNNNNYFGNRDQNIASQFQNFASMFGANNPMFAGGYQQAPMYNQGNPAPGAYGYAGAATPQGNPFGQPGGMPQPGQPNTGYSYSPNVGQATAPVQPTVQQPQQAVIDVEPAPVDGNGKTTVKETFNV